MSPVAHKVSVEWERVDPKRVAYRGGDLYTVHLPESSLYRPRGACSCGWRGEFKVKWIYAVAEADDHREEALPPRKRTKHGLTLEFRRGEWWTLDGEHAIGAVREITTCDGNPHPFHWISEDTGNKVQDYCDGMGEHDRECGYDIRSQSGGDSDLYGSLDEAWAELAKSVALDAQR